jgi:hypothetical protein
MSWKNGQFIRQNPTFSGPLVWQDDDGAGFGVVDLRQDVHDQGQADGVDQCLKLDGANGATANIDMNGFVVDELPDAVDEQDILNKGQADAAYWMTDGSNTPTSDVPFNGKKITGLGTSSTLTDLATLLQAEGVVVNAFAWCNGGTTQANEPFESQAVNCVITPLSTSQVYDVSWGDAGTGAFPLYGSAILIIPMLGGWEGAAASYGAYSGVPASSGSSTSNQRITIQQSGGTVFGGAIIQNTPFVLARVLV